MPGISIGILFLFFKMEWAYQLVICLRQRIQENFIVQSVLPITAYSSQNFADKRQHLRIKAWSLQGFRYIYGDRRKPSINFSAPNKPWIKLFPGLGANVGKVESVSAWSPFRG
jgi:hypothetical protein